MIFDYNKLKGKIKEKYKSQSNFALTIGWSNRTLSLKLNGKRAWTQVDICKAMKLLDLEEKDIQTYFFTPKVQYFE